MLLWLIDKRFLHLLAHKVVANKVLHHHLLQEAQEAQPQRHPYR
jgi:hypothetical protein